MHRLIFGIAIISIMLALPTCPAWAQDAAACSANLQSNPIPDAFPESMIKAGSIQERALQFQERWPNNVRIIDNVKFKLEAGGFNSEKSRKVIVISAWGLNEEAAGRLIADYTNYLSYNTVSHPLTQNAGHLYTRIGNKIVDQYGSFSYSEIPSSYTLGTYLRPGSRMEFIETYISLSDVEQTNLRTYIQNIRTQGRDATIGTNSYDGALQSEGTLTSNKPLAGCGGHNCTSWMSLAPIGENGETIKTLVGINSLDVYRNPGWWTGYIQAKAKDERVPFIVLFSPDPWNVLETKVRPNEILQWNLSPH